MIALITGNLTPAASRRIEIVAALPSHFRVDDPESTGFGRRIRINPNRSGGNPGFSGSRIRAIPDSEEEDQVVQPSTLEEVKAARVRKRNFSTSVISERTIQIGDGGGKFLLDLTHDIFNRSMYLQENQTSSLLLVKPKLPMKNCSAGPHRPQPPGEILRWSRVPQVRLPLSTTSALGPAEL